MSNIAKLKTDVWDLSELIKTPSLSEIDNRLKKISNKIKEFEDKKSLLNPDMTSSEFQQLIHDSESIAEELSVVSGYTHLKYCENTSANDIAALVTKTDVFATEASNKLLFFDLWFKKVLDESNARRLIDGAPNVYRSHLNHERSLSKHTLQETEEKIINLLDVTGISALIKIYDRMSNSFEYEYIETRGSRKIRKIFTNKEKMISLVRSSKPSERIAAYKALLTVYKKNSGVLGEIYLNRLLNWNNEYILMRKFPTPISVRNLANDISDKAVAALLNVCRANSKLFQDYFVEKAKLIKVNKLERYHLYAPIRSNDNIKVTYAKSMKMVMDAFQEFEPEFAKIVENLVIKKHIHSKLQNNKQGGAFCSTISPKISPYVLLNFDGTLRDVSTMAHEFGHAIHSELASDKPISVQHPSLPLAETASVFGEMILNDQILKDAKKKDRKIMLAEQIDDFYATIMRQAFFTIFEIEAHNLVGKNSATTVDELCDTYLNNLKEQFGKAVKITEDFKYEWLYIPHFYHSPFYCYAYSFGNLLVMSLYQQYKDEGKEFVPKYMSILSSGGSRKPEELLIENGIDITKESFWQKGFDLVGEKVRTLKEL